MDVRLQLRVLHDDLRSSFWFRPVLITTVAIGLSFALAPIDRLARMSPFWPIRSEDARAILSSIASSMFTVVALTFSIIMVALVLASQQFSPRILRNFARDRVSQNVLGIFLGTFIYSLLVMTHIGDVSSETPILSVLVAVLLALFSVGALIYFIDHITRTIRVSYMIAEITHQTIALLPRLLNPTSTAPSGGKTTAGQVTPRDEGKQIFTPRSGYLQSIDLDELMEIAHTYDALIVLERMTGDFVPQNSVLLQVWPAGDVSPALIDRLHGAFDIGVERTMLDDLLFGPRQLVDIALKAISPAVNDPTTASQCLDGLSDILVQAVRYPEAQAQRYDPSGTLRLIYRPATFADLLDLAMSQIRHYGATDLAVTLQLILVLTEVARTTTEPSYQTLLWQQSQSIHRSADRHIKEFEDRRKIDWAMQSLAHELRQPYDAIRLSDGEPSC
jgi:uncharacterized membrane protein